MFLAGDESISHDKKVYGFACSDENVYCSFESKICEVRLKYGLWGEIKLQKLPIVSNRLFNGYVDVIDLFLTTEGLQYYSIVYRRPNTPRLHAKGYSKKYLTDLRKTFHGRMIFMLARHISEKMFEAGMNGELSVLGDQSTTLNQEWSVIGDLMKDKSQRVKQKVSVCTFGNSAVSSYIQLADLLTGLISSKVNNRLNSAKTKLINHIQEILGYEIGMNDPVRYSRWGYRKVNSWHFHPTSKY